MDVKEAFNHVSWVQLAQKMADLGIEDDFIGWTQSFLTNWWVKLMINGYFYSKHKVETGILQGLLVSPILFLIYISRTFLQIETCLTNITCLLFMDDLSFLRVAYSILKIKKASKKVENIILSWETNNIVTYDICKTKTVFFSKAKNQKLIKQISEIEQKFGGQTVYFNQKATWWFEMWLNSFLNFGIHICETFKKAKIAEIRIQEPSKTYRLPPALVQIIQIAVV